MNVERRLTFHSDSAGCLSDVFLSDVVVCQCVSVEFDLQALRSSMYVSDS